MPGATILVVDDSAELLDFTSSVLEEAGYGVLRCGGSGEAMAILSDGHDIDLLLTDIMMPGGIDGFELASQARAVRPSLSVAYFAGHAQTLPEDARRVFGPILGKPYQRQDFTRQIDDLLAPIEDARLVQAVALEMLTRHRDALNRAKEAEEIDRAKGDELSARAWHDVAEAIAALQNTAKHLQEASRK
jgi:CheY-like chemotaxis protein